MCRVIVLLLCLFVCRGLASCSSTSDGDGYWHYALTRGLVHGFEFDGSSEGAGTAGFADRGGSNEGLAILMAGLLILPVVIDTVLLPVTVPHDLFFVD